MGIPARAQKRPHRAQSVDVRRTAWPLVGRVGGGRVWLAVRVYSAWERLVGTALADDGQLLDFIGAAGRGGGGVDGYLEEFAAGIENAQEVFLVGL